MKIWTGKFFLILAFVVATCLLSLGCSTSGPEKAATSEEIENEVSIKSDKENLDELRKDIPEEVKKSNDRIAATLKRWKQQKMAPEDLRSRFSDEIRKAREAMDKKHQRQRADFQKQKAKKRKEFQEKQKEARDDFFSHKPKGERRSDFISDQSTERERFNSDLRDERQDFEESIKDERKIFEGDIASRWVEFRQEYPEYSKLYREMKEAEAKQKEEAKLNPTPYAGWPYKADDEKPTGVGTGANPKATPPEAVDVNKGGNGWPTTDPSEFDQLQKSGTGP
ncbi:MAG: hypothetical protein SGI74_11260 [Oligoflexia bacterium]|nr:hypothetical protein [Oligoflexia bacterium]